KYGKPEIFNSDQGGQFTSPRFTRVLKEAGVNISMDGKGRWMDNVFIERLWRLLKCECVYLHAFGPVVVANHRTTMTALNLAQASELLLNTTHTTAARALIGWSRDDLARESRVSPNTVWGFEQGHSDPKLSTLNKWQRTLEQAG